jgi:large subunit ribosomal protein L5
MFDPNDPYTKFRYNPPVSGSQSGKKLAPPSTPDNIVYGKDPTAFDEAVANKSNLLSATMQIKALTGQNSQGGGQHAVEGVQIVHGRKSVGGWLRPGIPVGVKVDMRGRSMYDFLGTHVEFVLPRMREFSGIVLPPLSSPVNSPSAVADVVLFGLPGSSSTGYYVFPPNRGQLRFILKTLWNAHSFHYERERNRCSGPCSAYCE